MNSLKSRRRWTALKAVSALVIALLASSAAQADIILNMTAGSGTTSGFINGALFQVFDGQSAGSGVRHSFVRINPGGSPTAGAQSEGYNTDARPLEFDENNSHVFTHSLPLAAVPIVTIGGIQYREFLLDINQSGTSPNLSVQDIEIYMTNNPNATGYPGGLGTLIYDLEAGMAGNRIDLTFFQGSGAEDMFAYIPNSLFVGGTNVILYSRFGTSATEPGFINNDGFEEWAVRLPAGVPPPSPVPAPPAIVLFGVGAIGLGGYRAWRRRGQVVSSS